MTSVVRYENLRLFAAGVAGGAIAIVAWRASGARRVSIVAVLGAFVIAAVLASRTDRLHRVDGYVAFAAAVSVAAAVGAGRVMAASAAWSNRVLGAAVVSSGAVLLAVPETGPAVVVTGLVIGMTAACALTRSVLAPSGASGIAAAIGWAALSGAAGRPWAAVGGALCFGLAPWFAIVPRSLAAVSARALPGLLVTHAALATAAARWLAVSDGGWPRAAALAGAGALVVAATWVRA